MTIGKPLQFNAMEQAPYDEIPFDWTAQPAVVIGAGPSLTKAQCEVVRGKAKVIAVNRAIEYAPWADVWYFCDARFAMWHDEKIGMFRAEKWTLENRQLRSRWRNLRCLKNLGDGGHIPKPYSSTGIVNCRNGGGQAIQIAAMRGASPIALLGLDMKIGPGNQRQFHPPHPMNDPITVYEKNMLPRMAELAESLAERGLPVVNCTPDSAMTCFPKADISEVFGDSVMVSSYGG